MYLSIKWKAVLFLSVVLILLSGAWIWQSTEETWTNHKAQQQEKIKVQQNILNKILDDRYQQLSPMIQVLPSQEYIAPVLKQATIQVDKLQSYIEEFWFQLNFNMGVDYLGIYDEQLKSLAFQYSPDTISNIEQYVSQLSHRITKTKLSQPEQFIYCDKGCMHIVIEPVTLETGKQLYIAIGQNLSYLTQLFSSLSTDKLAILLPEQVNRNVSANRSLPNWRHSIWALSDYQNSYHILSHIADTQPFNDENQVSIGIDGRTFRLHKLAIETIDFLGSQPTLMVINDDTLTNKLLKESISNGIFTGIIALLLSEVILLFLLMGPIKRLINISEALKFLPNFEYDKARQFVSDHNRFVRDEITSLEHNANFVTNRLENLQNDVNDKELSLENKIKALDRARSFLSRLLDNSQLFIVTQDFNNIILTRNVKMAEILNNNDACFTHCISANDALSLHNTLRMLKKKRKHVTHHEGHSFNREGNEVYIAWTHTIVEDEEGRQVVLSIGTDLTKRKEAERALTWMANNDPLTGISNRRGFQEKIDELVHLEAHFSLVFIDVNRFKQINDVHGHSAGDEVLIAIANQLKNVTRQTDHISRLAGDEFTILLTRTSMSEVEAVLKKITEALQGNVQLAGKQVIEYGTSLGAAVYPTHAKDSETLIIYADMAMYQAKKKGMANWHIFSESDKHLDNLKQEHHYSSLIRDALKHHYFKLVFQPIMDVTAQNIRHYEVLLRMQLPEGRLAFPGEFIPVAEKNGLIRDIDKWVIEHALEELSIKRNENSQLTFGVNVSAPTLQSSSFPQLIQSRLEKHAVPAQHLVIELTETAYIENFSQVLENLKTLHKLGVKVALDDFGVGFSSFSYLKRLPLSYVKLDGSYIKNLTQNKDDQTFVKSLSEMVKAFGMQTIAEFVEDEETLKLLKQLGVNHVQGYHIGRPEAVIE